MNIHVSNADIAAGLDSTSRFAHDVLDGLSRAQKQVSPKYFYDAAGSHLFEQITLLPEYYPTRTELAILRAHADDIAGLADTGAALVEFGAGATTKARLLLATGRFASYVPVDISGDFLKDQADALRGDFPRLAIHPVAADFTQAFALPGEIAGCEKFGFFPGSTIGNFDLDDARDFLKNAKRILGTGAHLVIGVDLEKDTAILEPAYDDAAGVTARFNLNLLTRINDELDGDFDLTAFAHRAVYNRAQHRIEMHLVSRRAQTVHVCGRSFVFAEGESIHTESSYKYSQPRFAALADAAGWTVQRSWIDDDAMFCVHALRA